jgi:hypothetical protein
MRPFGDELSGSWSGWSVQYGMRISEDLHLVIRGNQISGVGSDKDGDFEVVGGYHPRSQRVNLTRIYTYTTEPSQSGVGVPYDYDGSWDGSMISGTWHPRRNPGSDGGPFEMWPNKGEEDLEISKLVQEVALSHPQ